MILFDVSCMMCYLFRLNVFFGFGCWVDILGYMVGGKMGIVEKIENGVYVLDKRCNLFLFVFLMDDLWYVVFVVLDELKLEYEGIGVIVGLNIVLIIGVIIWCVVLMFGVMFWFGKGDELIEIFY